MLIGTIEDYIRLALTVLISAFAGPFLGGYLRKKGENVATHEDIDKLLAQVSAVTAITKEIEAKISSEVWDRQKRWQMKREVLFEAARRLAELDDALLGYAIVMREDHAKQKTWEAGQEPPTEEKLAWFEVRGQRVTRWTKASTAFDETRLFVGVVCGKESKEAFDDLGKFVNLLASQISKNPNSYNTSRTDFSTKLLVARNLVRKELEVDQPS